MRSFSTKIFISCLLSLFITYKPLLAQVNKATNTASQVQNSDSVIEAKLVELAMKAPASEISVHQNKINEYQLKAAKNSWLNLLSLSGNYNDQTFAKQTSNTNYVYPKFYFGVTVPLGTILSRTSVKSAKEQIAISELNQEQLERAITADIIGKYRQYKTYTDLIGFAKEVADDYQVELLEAKKKFSDEKISIEVHNTASKKYNDALAALTNTQLQQDLLKLDIERIIGTKLENVLYGK